MVSVSVKLTLPGKLVEGVGLAVKLKLTLPGKLMDGVGLAVDLSSHVVGLHDEQVLGVSLHGTCNSLAL